MDESQHGKSNLFSFIFEIGDLAADQALTSRGDGQFAEDGADAGPRPAGNKSVNFERDGQQGISGEYGDSFTKNFVRSGHTTPEIIVIHAGQIVMNQRIGMYTLHRA